MRSLLLSVIFFTLSWSQFASATNPDQREALRQQSEILGAISEVKSQNLFDLLTDERFNPLFSDHGKTMKGLQLIATLTTGTSATDARSSEMDTLGKALKLILEQNENSAESAEFVKAVLQVLSLTNTKQITNVYLLGVIEIAKGSEKAEDKKAFFEQQVAYAKAAMEKAEADSQGDLEVVNALQEYLEANKEVINSTSYITALIKDLLQGSHEGTMELLSNVMDPKTFERIKGYINVDMDGIGGKADKLKSEVREKLQQCLTDLRITFACIAVVTAIAQGSVALAAISTLVVFSDRIMAHHGVSIYKNGFSAVKWLATLGPYLLTIQTKLKGGFETIASTPENVDKYIRETLTDENISATLNEKFNLNTVREQATSGGSKLFGAIRSTMTSTLTSAEAYIRENGGGELLDRIQSNIQALIAKVSEVDMLKVLQKDMGEAFSDLGKDFLNMRTDGVEEQGEPTTFMSFLEKGRAAVATGMTSVANTAKSAMGSEGDASFGIFDFLGMEMSGDLNCQTTFDLLN